MHTHINGYGFGAVSVAHMKADARHHRKVPDCYDTNYTRQYDSIRETPNMRDHRHARITQHLPRDANATLSSTAYGRQLGTFAGTVSATVGPDPMASSFKRDDKRMTRIREGGPRPENYGLTSGDYGEPRNLSPQFEAVG